MGPTSGTKLGPCEIVSPLGAGGVGEVYRARDPQLGRDVAIKILLSFLSRDPERLRRFEQEARAAAALNHPNILAVYDAKAAADKALAFARQTVDRSSNFAASMAVAEVNIRRGKK
jgi:serine/threonine protein kinase